MLVSKASCAIPKCIQDIGAKGRRLGIRARATPLQDALEFARDPARPGLQARPVQFAAAERPPVGEEAFHDLQTHPAHRFSGSSSMGQLPEVAFQVGPADLPQSPEKSLRDALTGL